LTFAFDFCSQAQAQRNIVAEGLHDIEMQTCVRFVPRSTQDDYIEIIDGDGCYSYLGRIGGRQVLSLNKTDCVRSKGTTTHEFIHALG
jgi:Astacin (Peptidase family M12A)